MFEGFQQLKVQTQDVRFSGVVGGSGPPVLLLHGYPQTRVAWRFVATALMEKYSIVAPGPSRLWRKPHPESGHFLGEATGRESTHRPDG
jgi:pimeloyl-ACP methyl ester carboxylesterase